MSRKLGKSYQQIESDTQESFNFTSRTLDPPSSFEAAEDITASGKREKHKLMILSAMCDLHATKEKPVTGLQIAQAAGMTVVEVMRRLRVDLAYRDRVKSTDHEEKMRCPINGKRKLGWYLLN